MHNIHPAFTSRRIKTLPRRSSVDPWRMCSVHMLAHPKGRPLKFNGHTTLLRPFITDGQGNREHSRDSTLESTTKNPTFLISRAISHATDEVVDAGVERLLLNGLLSSKYFRLALAGAYIVFWKTSIGRQKSETRKADLSTKYSDNMWPIALNRNVDAAVRCARQEETLIYWQLVEAYFGGGWPSHAVSNSETGRRSPFGDRVWDGTHALHHVRTLDVSVLDWVSP